MPFPSVAGTSYGTCDRFSFRPLRLAIAAAGKWGSPEAIGSYMVTLLREPHTLTDHGSQEIACSSRHWLLAWAPHVIEDGVTKGTWINLALYQTHRCPGHWPSWKWDGNIDRPTLTPSIGSPRMAEGIGWHGYLVGGDWQGV